MTKVSAPEIMDPQPLVVDVNPRPERQKHPLAVEEAKRIDRVRGEYVREIYEAAELHGTRIPWSE
jgi:hypothetical protein